MSDRTQHRPTKFFISRKELAAAYQVTTRTLRKELAKVPGLDRKKYQRLFNAREQEIIYAHMGNPFLD